MAGNRSKASLNCKAALAAAVDAAQATGDLMRRNLHRPKRANATTQHDIKLELDVRAQSLITSRLRRHFPKIPLLGEEGDAGDVNADHRWVVDPIDGTVNYAYGIPHACVSIALQERCDPSLAEYPDGFRTLIGAVYDPFNDEMWTAVRGGPARLNGRIIRVSRRRVLREAVVTIGFAKTRTTLECMLPYFNELVFRVRKVRVMGAAALAMTYVAMGRFDAYIEGSIRIWDIAAGGLILQCAGGQFWRRQNAGRQAFRIVASNGLLHRALKVPEAKWAALKPG